jgi:hypothetical protein
MSAGLQMVLTLRLNKDLRKLPEFSKHEKVDFVLFHISQVTEPETKAFL